MKVPAIRATSKEVPSETSATTLFDHYSVSDG